MGRILVIGSSNTDMVVKTERLPRPGETVLGGRFLMNPGGKGANQAVAAARRGGDVTFITKVGKDVFGDETLASLKRESICTQYVLRDEEHASGVALIMVDEKGENSISVASGANAALMPEEVLRTLEGIESADVMLLQLEIPIPSVLAAAKWAHAKGIPVVLNPAPAFPLPPELLACVDILTPNETEAEMLSGVKVTDEASAVKAALALRTKGVKNTLITMGKQGACLCTEEGSCMIPARKVQAVDTTAAGDVFNGALAVGISEGLPLQEACHLASQAAAISVTRLGAQASAPYRSELG